MTVQELFDRLMAWPQPTRTEILNHLEEVTRNYEPERVDALLADFADMLFQWQCNETYDRAKREYDEIYSVYEMKLHFAEYAFAMGTNEPIEWPDEPLPFIPPYPGTIAENIHIPAMYHYATELLKSKTAKQNKIHPKKLPPELSTPEASAIFSAVENAGYCSADGDGYRWENTTALLAYFIDEVSRALKLHSGNYNLKWDLFLPIFGIYDLSESKLSRDKAKQPYKNVVSGYGSVCNPDKALKGYNNPPDGWEELKKIIYDVTMT